MISYISLCFFSSSSYYYVDFPYVDSDGKMQIADLLAVDIDLDTRKMVKCKMDGEHLTPSIDPSDFLRIASPKEPRASGGNFMVVVGRRSGNEPPAAGSHTLPSASREMRHSCFDACPRRTFL